MGDVNKQVSQKDDADLELLEKGLNGSLESLKNLLGGNKTDLKKAKKEKNDVADEDEEDAEDIEDEEGDYYDDEEDEDEDDMKKSLSDFVAEDDTESEIAMDVAPFLKSLTKGIQKYLDVKFLQLKKSLTGVQDLVKAQGNVIASSTELQKALNMTVVKIGQEAQPLHSKLRKSGDRFTKQEGVGHYDNRVVLQKSFELLKEGRITPLMATKIEHRVNAGADLPEEVAHLFKEA